MNPFSKFLRQWSSDGDMHEFIAYWDRLEKLTIDVYKGKANPEEALPEFNEVWGWLRQRYGRFESQLEPYWQLTLAAGEPTKTDPFQLLLAISDPAEIQGNWMAMQHLPAAREALNQLLLAESPSSSER